MTYHANQLGWLINFSLFGSGSSYIQFVTNTLPPTRIKQKKWLFIFFNITYFHKYSFTHMLNIVCVHDLFIIK